MKIIFMGLIRFSLRYKYRNLLPSFRTPTANLMIGPMVGRTPEECKAWVRFPDHNLCVLKIFHRWCNVNIPIKQIGDRG